MNRTKLIEHLLFNLYGIHVDGSKIWSYIIQNVSFEHLGIDFQDLYYTEPITQEIIQLGLQVHVVEKKIDIRIQSINNIPIEILQAQICK